MVQEHMAEGTPGPGPEGGSPKGGARPAGVSESAHAISTARWGGNNSLSSVTNNFLDRLRGKEPQQPAVNEPEPAEAEEPDDDSVYDVPVEPLPQAVTQGSRPPESSPSPIPDLTSEDIKLFEANGITLTDLEEIRAKFGHENFLEQAKARLEQFRQQAKQAVLTPEEEDEERKRRIQELREELAILQRMPANTDQDRVLVEARRVEVQQELQGILNETGDSQASEDGGRGNGSERPAPPEGPPPPPDSNNTLEYEASPERGREIVEEIVKREGLRAAGRLSEIDWKRLDDLYLQHEIHIEAVRMLSLKLKHSGPKPPSGEELEVRTINAEIFNGSRPLTEWIAEYDRGAVIDEERFSREVDAYLAEAERVGLLKDLKTVLSIANRDMRQGISRNLTSDEIMFGKDGRPGIEHAVQNALNTFNRTLRSRVRTDRGISNLVGVGQLYAQLVLDRFASAITAGDREGLAQEGYLDHEFHLGLEEDYEGPKETYWRLQHGWYIEVYAETEEEFLIAADSYISRLQSITSDAKKVTQEASQFTDVVAKSEGAKRLLETNPTFIPRLILGVEGRTGAFGADDNNERYNGPDYKAFLDFTNKDGKGPDRWLELFKMLDGRVAAALWKLDKDPRWEMLFATYGSRGQLAHSSIAQRDRLTGQGVHNQVYNMLIEEMLGVQMKNPEDNEELTKFMSDREFTQFYDGLYTYNHRKNHTDYGDANIKAWQAVKDKPDNELTSAQRQSKRNGAIRLGRIQQELRDGKKLTELSASDQKFYRRALADAKKAVDIAFQIYGAFGEKSKRGGGVFKTAEKTDDQGKKYRYFVPIHWAEKWVQCAETLTKIQYAHLSAKERTAKVKQARERNIAIFKQDGFEAKMVDADGNSMNLKGLYAEDPDLSDFYLATHHPYGDWSGHTYWSYQEEHRHLLLSPVTFTQARQIIDGTLRPEEADPVAVQLLILDPTLRRVRMFEKGFEDRERKLTMAAVEDSYQSHWRITRELYKAFWPKYGTPTEEIGIYYGLQDFGGYRKMLESMRARFAEDPDRFARRGRRLIPDLHNPVATLPEYLGQGTTGTLGALRMMAYPIYRLAGTFALDKFAANAEIGGKVYDALYNTQDQEAEIVEGVLLKLTNDADINLQQFGRPGLGGLPEIKQNLAPPRAEWLIDQTEFLSAVRKSFGRLEKYLKKLVVMESLVRNATGAFWLENVDIFTDNEQLTKDIETRLQTLPAINWIKSDTGLTREDFVRFFSGYKKITEAVEEKSNNNFNKEAIDEGGSPDTGSGRHSAKIIFDTFIKLMLDEEKRGGGNLYPGERIILKHLNDRIVYYDPTHKKKNVAGFVETNQTIADWLFAKIVAT